LAVIKAARIIIVTVEQDYLMELTNQPEVGVAGRDDVSAWILKMAIGMSVLFVVFTVLDLYQFFPHLPERPQSHLLLDLFS
jgi:hypothetical protein